jgi:hypothetical protein
MFGKEEEEEEGGGCSLSRPVMCLLHTCVELVPSLACVTRVQVCVVTTSEFCAMCNVWPRAPEGSR